MKGIIALILISVCTILNLVAYLPQIIQLIKTKSAEDINVFSWLTWIVSGGCYLGYVALESPEIGIISLESMILLMMIIVCVLSAYYKRRARKHKRIHCKK